MTDRYVPVQARRDLDYGTFVISSNDAMFLGDAVIAQDAGRTIDLEPNTLFVKFGDGANLGKWRSFVTETATNGSAIPQGIYVGPKIASADIVAGDVEGAAILIIGYPVVFDEEKLVIENAKTLETIISNGTKDFRSVRDHLRILGLIPRLISSSIGGSN